MPEGLRVASLQVRGVPDVLLTLALALPVAQLLAALSTEWRDARRRSSRSRAGPDAENAVLCRPPAPRPADRFQPLIGVAAIQPHPRPRRAVARGRRRPARPQCAIEARSRRARGPGAKKKFAAARTRVVRSSWR